VKWLCGTRGHLNVFEGLTRTSFKRNKRNQSGQISSYDLRACNENTGTTNRTFVSEWSLGMNEVAQNKFPVFNGRISGRNAVPGGGNYTRKDIDEWVKRPQVGASGMVYVKCNEDGT
jgi:aspartyl-tRNA synthetase